VGRKSSGFYRTCVIRALHADMLAQYTDTSTSRSS